MIYFADFAKRNLRWVVERRRPLPRCPRGTALAAKKGQGAKNPGKRAPAFTPSRIPRKPITWDVRKDQRKSLCGWEIGKQGFYKAKLPSASAFSPSVRRAAKVFAVVPLGACGRALFISQCKTKKVAPEKRDRFPETIVIFRSRKRCAWTRR